MEVRRTEWRGLSVVIETDAGQVREWSQPDGTTGRTRLAFPYGYLDGIAGSDGDDLDCYLGRDPEARFVYVVHQLTPDGRRDEDKVLLDFGSAAAAEAAYLQHRDDGDRAYGGMSAIPVNDFLAKLRRRTSNGKIRHGIDTANPMIKTFHNLRGTNLRGWAGRTHTFDALDDAGKVRVGVWDRFATYGEGEQGIKVKDGDPVAFNPDTFRAMIDNWAARGQQLTMCLDHRSALGGHVEAPAAALYDAIAVIDQNGNTLYMRSVYGKEIAKPDPATLIAQCAKYPAPLNTPGGLWGFRAEVTPKGAHPTEGLANYRGISPMFVMNGTDEQERPIGPVLFDVAAVNVNFQGGCELTLGMFSAAPAAEAAEAKRCAVCGQPAPVKLAAASPDLTPPKGAQEEAQRGLDWRREHGRGGTEVGIARGRDIAGGKSLSPETIARMVSFFARHEGDKQGKGWSPGEEGYPSNGRIAWALWGGDAGKAWAEKVAAQLDEEETMSAASSALHVPGPIGEDKPNMGAQTMAADSKGAPLAVGDRIKNDLTGDTGVITEIKDLGNGRAAIVAKWGFTDGREAGTYNDRVTKMSAPGGNGATTMANATDKYGTPLKAGDRVVNTHDGGRGTVTSTNGVSTDGAPMIGVDWDDGTAWSVPATWVQRQTMSASGGVVAMAWRTGQQVQWRDGDGNVKRGWIQYVAPGESYLEVTTESGYGVRLDPVTTDVRPVGMSASNPARTFSRGTPIKALSGGRIVSGPVLFARGSDVFVQTPGGVVKASAKTAVVKMSAMTGQLNAIAQRHGGSAFWGAGRDWASGLDSYSCHFVFKKDAESEARAAESEVRSIPGVEFEWPLRKTDSGTWSFKVRFKEKP